LLSEKTSPVKWENKLMRKTGADKDAANSAGGANTGSTSSDADEIEPPTSWLQIAMLGFPGHYRLLLLFFCIKIFLIWFVLSSVIMGPTVKDDPEKSLKLQQPPNGMQGENAEL